MSSINKTFKQKGETIVEVLLAITVVMFTLSIGYNISRRSLKTIRKSEERAQSVQFAQQQIERFKQYLQIYPNVTTKKTSLGQAGTILPDGHSGFCFYKDLTKKDVPTAVGVDDGTKNPICAVNSAGEFYCEQSGNPCGGSAPSSVATDNAGYFYRAGIAYFPPAHNLGSKLQDQFYALAGVFSVGDTANDLGFDVVTIPYRIHQ